MKERVFYMLWSISVGFVLGIWFIGNCYYYRVNCDTTKFSFHWVSNKQLHKEGFICKNTNQTLIAEPSFYTSMQLMWLDMKGD